MQTRRLGDTIAIGGDYQHRALHTGNAVQRAWHRSKLLAIDALLRPVAGERMLDAGCGSGVCSGYLAEQGCQVIGVDGNPEAIDFATRQYGGPGMQFRLGYLDELQIETGSIDGAICLEVVEHLEIPQVNLLLKSLAAALRPGGRLLLTTPNYRSLWPAIETTLDALRLVPTLQGEQHVSKFTHRRLRSIAQEQGLHLVAARSICTLGPWIAPLSMRLFETSTKWELGHALPFGTILAHLYTRP